MVSPPIRNLLGGVCLAFLLCGTLMAWSKHKVTTSTLVVSADRDESNEQEATAQTFKNQKRYPSPSTKKISKTVKIVSIPQSHRPNNSTTAAPAASADDDKVTTTLSTSSTSFSTSFSTSKTNTVVSSESAMTADNKLDGLYEDDFEWPDVNPEKDIDFPMDYKINDDLKHVLQIRKEKLYKKCQLYKNQIKKSIKSTNKEFSSMRKRNPNVIVSSKHSIEFCSVAKTGSTFWKSVFGYLGTGTILPGMSAARLLRKSYRNSFETVSDLARNNKGDLRFVAVRNPWKRLVSLYQQKIEVFVPTVISQGLSSKKQVKDMAPYRYMLGVCHMQPPDLLTFEDMIACVVTKNIGRTPNRHWEPAYEYCDICSIDYDYIIRTENMMKEGAYVLRQAGLANATDILSAVREGTIRDVEKHKKKKYSDYYRDLHPDVIEVLRRMYQWEIELFGYPHTPFTN